MGNSASVQTIVTTINNSINETINNSAAAHGNIDCLVEIGNFKIGYTENCSVEFKNNCSAEAGATIENFISAAVQAVTNISNDQREQMAKYFTNSLNIATTSTNLNDSVTLYIKNKCSAFANVTNTIKIDDIEIGKCISTTDTGTSLKFINAGSAVAHCIVSNVINDSVQATNNVSNQQTSGTDWVKLLQALMWPIVIGLIVIAGVFALFTFMKNMKPLSGADKAAIELAKNNSWASHVLAVKGKI